MPQEFDLFGESLGNTEHRFDPNPVLTRVDSVKKKDKETKDYCLHSAMRPYELIRISSTSVLIMHK